MDCERSDCKEVIAALRQRAEKAEKEIQNITEGWREVMDEPCDEDDDRKHCSCVPALRTAVESLKADLAAALKRAETAEHAVAHLKAALEEEGIDSSAIEYGATSGGCVFEAERDALKAEVTRLKTLCDQAQASAQVIDEDRMEFAKRITALEAAAREALERLGGDAKDGNLGWHKDHPVVAMLRSALAAKEEK